MSPELSLVVGLVIGALIVAALFLIQRKTAKDIAKEIAAQTESQRLQDLEALVARLKESFAALSLDAISRNTREFLALANETLSKQTISAEKTLENKKELIDQTLQSVQNDLQKLSEIMVSLEKDRESKFSELATHLETAGKQTQQLQQTTEQLALSLSNTKARGQWGERMAEDILKHTGFIEGINYTKQTTTGTKRPDYTFLLPQGRKLNMDVKFPLDNYLRYTQAQNQTEKEKLKNLFLLNVRDRIKEVVSREYINPEENTLDYALVFIPNEQVYAFIQECDNSMLDEALEKKVVLCSPITLYATLAIIRQSMDNFTLEQTTDQIMSLMNSFKKQYKLFMESLDKIGDKISEAQKEYDSLVTTRKNKLEKPLNQIEELRKQKGIQEAEPADDVEDDSKKEQTGLSAKID